MEPTEETLQKIFLEAALSAANLLKKLIEKESLTTEEKNAADVALKFLEIINHLEH